MEDKNNGFVIKGVSIGNTEFCSLLVRYPFYHITIENINFNIHEHYLAIYTNTFTPNTITYHSLKINYKIQFCNNFFVCHFHTSGYYGNQSLSQYN